MSIGEPNKINISAKEGPRQNGQRSIEGYVLEIPNRVPSEIINGRTDGFDGMAFRLTTAEAEALHQQLGESLEFIRPLLESGKLKENKQG